MKRMLTHQPRLFAEDLGKGLVAGAIGTALMSVSSNVEQSLRKRPSSSAPAEAVTRVFGVKPEGEEEKKRLGALAHWGYGTALGALRAAIASLGMRGTGGTVVFFGVVWGTEVTMLPKLEVAPPLTEWGAKEIAIDLWHHAVYATATGLAFVALDRMGRTD